MELRHLRYFVAAAEEQHFGRAADTLFVTRPAVSQTISDLEAELGVQLFDRRAHKVTLTAAGVALLKHARVLLDDLSQAVALTKRIGQGKSGLLNIGYGSLSLLHPLFRDAVKQVGIQYPDAELALHEMPSSAQVEAIRAGKLDAGFVYVAGDGGNTSSAVPGFGSIEGLSFVEIEQGALAVAMPPDHPLATRDSLQMADLEDEDFVFVRRSILSRDFGFAPRIVQEVSNIATQINLISVGMGIGLVVSSPGLRWPPTVRVTPLNPNGHVSQFNLAWRPGAVEPLLEHFIGIVRDLAKAY